MKSDSLDVVLIGSITNETIFTQNNTIGPVLGGACAYSALALSKAGRQTAIVTYCGTDVKERLEKELRLVDKRGILAYDYTMENHLVYTGPETYQEEYFKTTPMICYDDLELSCLDADMFFICPMNYEVQTDIPVRLNNSGKKVCIDLRGYGGRSCSNHFPVTSARGKKLMEKLGHAAWLLKAGEEDLHYLIPETSTEEAMMYLSSLGPEYIIVTLGDRGCAYLKSGETVEYVNSYPADLQAHINLTGAGDVQIAGVISSLLRDPGDIKTAVQYGNSMASLCLEEPGGCVEDRMPDDRLIRLRMRGKI